MSHNHKHKKRTRTVGTANKQAKWSRKVRSRNGYKCDICLSTKELTAHHLNSADTQNRWSVDNGITLCATCHKRFHQSHWQSHGCTIKPCTANDYYRYKERTIAKYCRAEGRKAFHNGFTRRDNPYTTTEHYLWWDRAFRYEQQQATNKQHYLQEF